MAAATTAVTTGMSLGDLVPLIREYVRDAEVRRMMYRVQADLELLAEQENRQVLHQDQLPLSSVDAVLDARISDALVRRAPEWTRASYADVADYFSRVEEMLCALPTTELEGEDDDVTCDVGRGTGDDSTEDGGTMTTTTTTTSSMSPRVCKEDEEEEEEEDGGSRAAAARHGRGSPLSNRMEEGLRAVRARASSALVLSCLAVALSTYAVSTYYYYSRCRATFSLSYGGGGGAEEDLL